jgi:hypothetical protein
MGEPLKRHHARAFRRHDSRLGHLDDSPVTAGGRRGSATTEGGSAAGGVRTRHARGGKGASAWLAATGDAQQRAGSEETH